MISPALIQELKLRLGEGVTCTDGKTLVVNDQVVYLGNFDLNAIEMFQSLSDGLKLDIVTKLKDYIVNTYTVVSKVEVEVTPVENEVITEIEVASEIVENTVESETVVEPETTVDTEVQPEVEVVTEVKKRK